MAAIALDALRTAGELATVMVLMTISAAFELAHWGGDSGRMASLAADLAVGPTKRESRPLVIERS